jgi:hypothetical protein
MNPTQLTGQNRVKTEILCSNKISGNSVKKRKAYSESNIGFLCFLKEKMYLENMPCTVGLNIGKCRGFLEKVVAKGVLLNVSRWI